MIASLIASLIARLVLRLDVHVMKTQLSHCSPISAVRATKPHRRYCGWRKAPGSVAITQGTSVCLQAHGSDVLTQVLRGDEVTIYASDIAGLDGQYPNVQKLIKANHRGDRFSPDPLLEILILSPPPMCTSACVLSGGKAVTGQRK